VGAVETWHPGPNTNTHPIERAPVQQWYTIPYRYLLAISWMSTIEQDKMINVSHIKLDTMGNIEWVFIMIYDHWLECTMQMSI
jgi:hypothetical protein